VVADTLVRNHRAAARVLDEHEGERMSGFGLKHAEAWAILEW
jgi:hypothetical protein